MPSLPGKQNPNYLHGMSGTKIYRIWHGIITRCHTKTHKESKRYSNIRVCKRWLNFKAFYRDMGNCPNNMSIDRIDNYGDYKPSNCRWATPKEQARNRKSSRYIIYKNKKKTLAEWCELYKIHPYTITCRIRRGWTLNDTFLIRPVRGRNQSFRKNML